MSASKYLISSFFLLLTSIFYGQQQDLSKASVFHLNRMLKQAEIFEDTYTKISVLEALVKKESSEKFRWELAEAYKSIHYYSKAKENYLPLLNSSEFKLASFFYAKMLKQEGDYDSALQVFTSIVPNSSHDNVELENEKLGCEMALREMDEESPIEIEHFDKTINSVYSEKSPTLSKDSLLIYSGRKSDSTHIYNIGKAKKQSIYNTLYAAEELGGIWKDKGKHKFAKNMSGQNLSNAFDWITGNRSFFSVTEKGEGGSITNLYQSIDGKEASLMNINKEGSSSTQACIGYNNEGRPILFFSTNREGGKGGYDIWYANFDSTIMDFTSPSNAGSNINSMGDEITPYFDSLTSTLYFSSSGMPGYGGLDIFKSIGHGKDWGTSENLGFHFNSSADDLYFYLNRAQKAGFFTSNRTGGNSIQHPNCCDDIYGFKYKVPVSTVLEVEILGIGAQKDSLGNPLVSLYLSSGDSCVRLRDNRIVKEACDVRISQTQLADGQTKCFYDIMVGSEYEIKTYQSGSLAKSLKVYMKKEEYKDTLRATIQLYEYTEEAIEIENVYYEYNSAELKEESKKSLDETLVLLLKENPHIVVEIGSHTDSVGSFNYNYVLSQKRAEGVVEYLIDQGINPDQIEAQGYGELKPIVHNTNLDGTDNVEGRAKNRRTEFKIIGEIEDALKVED